MRTTGGLANRNLGLITTDPEIAGAVENALEQLRAIAPNSAEFLIAQTYYIYYVLRDYDHAHDVVSRALTKNPSDVDVLQLKAWIERRQGNWDARIESFRELAKLDPREPGWTSR